jgi:hypothetical protein
MTQPAKSGSARGMGAGWRALSNTHQMQEAIDDAVDDWHEGAGVEGESLHEYLGMTWAEYGEWVQTGRLP